MEATDHPDSAFSAHHGYNGRFRAGEPEMASEKRPTQIYYSSKMKQQPEGQAPASPGAWPGGRELLEDRIYVGRIPDKLLENELGHYFERFGRVSSVVIIPTPDYKVWIN